MAGQGRNEKNTFDPKLFYLVGKTKTGKYDFNLAGFKSKTDRDGTENSPIESTLSVRKQQFEYQGYTDIKVVTGTKLAIMIASGETSAYKGF